MPESISTHYVKRGYATSEDIVLSETARTRTVFRPGLHAGGVRGEIIRQKRGADGSWKDVNEVNFTKVPADCGVAIELDTEATTKLYEKLTSLYQVQGQGVQYGDQDFVVAKKDEVLIIDDSAKTRAIKELLQKGYSEEFWGELIKSDPDLASRLAVAKLQLDRKAVIDQLEASLDEHPDDEAFWQEFIAANPWILQSVFRPLFSSSMERPTWVASYPSEDRERVALLRTFSRRMQAPRALPWSISRPLTLRLWVLRIAGRPARGCRMRSTASTRSCRVESFRSATR